MKLLRVGAKGCERPALLDPDGQLRDLSGIVSHIDQETISPRGMAKLRKIRPESLPLVRANPRFGVPYTGISKIVAIGRTMPTTHRRQGKLCLPSRSFS